MFKKFSLQIPLDIDNSFELVKQSGEEIVSWGASSLSEENYYLEWKQSFWSLTGTSLISVTMKRKEDELTDVAVVIHKPMQIVDPLGICYRVFRKLEKAIEKNYALLQQEDESE